MRTRRSLRVSALGVPTSNLLFGACPTPRTERLRSSVLSWGGGQEPGSAVHALLYFTLLPAPSGLW
eukprot:6809422-Pyramimonas_sp.AAC.1